MKALITGSNGTVGSVLRKTLQDSGNIAVGWDRNRAPAGDMDAARELLDEVAPDVIFHVALPSQSTGIENEGWLVNEKWTAEIATLCGERSIPMVYTSTVMVFSNKAKGPFLPETEPDEMEGYGMSKLNGERAAIAANPDVRIARLGWQIGHTTGSNNMFHYLDKQFVETGEVTASTEWLPATSFLEDTANALIRIAQLEPGIYHVDSNDGWNFYEIVCALNKLHGGRWKVRATTDFTQDQRMSDPRPQTASLSERLELPRI